MKTSHNTKNTKALNEMNKIKSYYFQHDCNARDDNKIINLRIDKGAAGYGIYFLLLELLSTADNCTLECNYKKIAFQLSVDEKEIKEVVEDYGLFKLNDNTFSSPRLTMHMGELMEMRKRMSEIGKNGLRKRWNKEAANDDKDSEEDSVRNSIRNSASNSVRNSIKDNIIKDNIREDTKKKDNNKLLSKKESSHFVKPSLDEVTAYCQERGNEIDAHAFIDFYESKGWMVGKNHMKDWKAAIRTWERSRTNDNPTTPQNTRLGVGEYITPDGRRTYAGGRATVPMDAPPRPYDGVIWDSGAKRWVPYC